MSIISGTNERESLFQCGGFLDRQTGIEPLIIDWTQEEAKMVKIVQYNSCLLLIILFLSQVCNTFLARSITLKEFYLMMNLFYSFQKIRKNANLTVKPL